MGGAVPPLPNAPSWRGAQLGEHRENFTFTFLSVEPHGVSFLNTQQIALFMNLCGCLAMKHWLFISYTAGGEICKFYPCNSCEGFLETQVMKMLTTFPSSGFRKHGRSDEPREKFPYDVFNPANGCRHKTLSMTSLGRVWHLQ
jgi:hypothetical protein